jgi:hypothetical protein
VEEKEEEQEEDNHSISKQWTEIGMENGLLQGQNAPNCRKPKGPNKIMGRTKKEKPWVKSQSQVHHSPSAMANCLC